MRVYSGMQSTGKPHIGNYLGAMKQHIAMQDEHECIYFIANLHSLTTVRDGKLLRDLTYELALDYLALGLNPDKTIFFKQSDVPEHSELTWIFDCITNMGVLERAHAWKDAKQKGLKDPSVGLFNYPILMAADILLYNPDSVPVGKDQKQHIEITRDIAEKFNNLYGETFKIPDPMIKEEVQTIIGTDGEHKMSKSYNNTIEFFAPENELKKQIMGMVTDSKSVDEPKDPENSNIYKLYSHFASDSENKDFAQKFQAEGMGYGDAKKLLFEKILDYFSPYRKKREEMAKNVDYIDEVLQNGAKRAREIATKTLEDVKDKTGLK